MKTYIDKILDSDDLKSKAKSLSRYRTGTIKEKEEEKDDKKKDKFSDKHLSNADIKNISKKASALNEWIGNPLREPEEADDIVELKKVVDLYKKAKAENNENEMIRLRALLIDELAKSFKPEAEEIVKDIENDKLKTTRGNYGRYMSMISRSGLSGMYKSAFIKAMKNAGAGQGLDDALNVMRGTL